MVSVSTKFHEILFRSLREVAWVNCFVLFSIMARSLRMNHRYQHVHGYSQARPVNHIVIHMKETSKEKCMLEIYIT